MTSDKFRAIEPVLIGLGFVLVVVLVILTLAVTE